MTAAAAMPRHRRRLSWTLSGYIARQYMLWFIVFLLAISGIVLLAGTADRMDRMANRDGVTFGIVLSVAVFRLPSLIQETMPFVVLGAAMFTFWRLTRTNELVVTRAAGVSAWQFLLPAVALSVLVGILTMTILNPVGATLLSRADQIEESYDPTPGPSLALRGGGLWLRQDQGADRLMLHASRADEETMTLYEVIVFRYQDEEFLNRMDASSATLEPGYWAMRDVWLSQAGTPTIFEREVRIPTNLTSRKILESFAPAETLSFWDLPEFIRLLQEAGFSTQQHRLEFNKLLALPLLFTAMVVLAATFSLRPQRRGRVGLIILAGVICGFVLYFMSSLVFALGISGKLPVAMAAWTPATIALALSLPLLLHLEDG
ncbi:LPS export ABC transporter permease LptG [Algihabitans albus]|uniref:LPS export ABC transporter permease LptG n=1 Tax=Algihabitans albus TaxID=2164067 RepID=UPI000E5C9D5B|nr:LPS export ABC transporter permease LptG [Algihabitans albus]